MRASVLALITLLSVPACSSRDTATAPAASNGPDKASGPSLPIPSVPQISKWELDPENSSADFVCKHVFSNVRGMFQQPSGTVILDEATPANSNPRFVDEERPGCYRCLNKGFIQQHSWNTKPVIRETTDVRKWGCDYSLAVNV